MLNTTKTFTTFTSADLITSETREYQHEQIGYHRIDAEVKAHMRGQAYEQAVKENDGEYDSSIHTRIRELCALPYAVVGSLKRNGRLHPGAWVWVDLRTIETCTGTGTA